MPKMTYTPEGLEDNPYVYEFAFTKLRSDVVMGMERATGLTLSEIESGFWSKSITVVHAVLYAMMKRDGKAPRDRAMLNFTSDEVELDLSDDEAREALRRYDAGEVNPGAEMTESDRAQMEAIRERFGTPSDEDADPKGSVTPPVVSTTKSPS